MMIMMMYDWTDLYYCLMGRSTFTTIYMKVLCDDVHIMTHVIENDITVVNDGIYAIVWLCIAIDKIVWYDC